MDQLDYTVTVSPRARQVRLRISVYGGRLTVIIPRGFDRRLIPGIVASKRAWIARTRARIAEQRERAQTDVGDGRPDRVALPALGEEWRVDYQPEPRADGRVTLVEQAGHVALVRGNVEDAQLCHGLLRLWMQRKARAALVPWLLRLSREHGLPVAGARVRGQRTRWGSCSSRGTISLNRRLLFLPPTLVEYVMLHELCHGAHPDHSPGFWSLLESRLPGARALDKQLRQAWRFVPRWMEEADRA